MTLKKRVGLLLLTILLICWTKISLAEENSSKPKVPRIITDKVYTSVSVLPIIDSPAPDGTYVYHQLPFNWGVVNTFFWNKINYKLRECMAQESALVGVVDNLYNEPECTEPSLPWYKDPEVIFYGLPITFSLGALVGIIISEAIK